MLLQRACVDLACRVRARGATVHSWAGPQPGTLCASEPLQALNSRVGAALLTKQMQLFTASNLQCLCTGGSASEVWLSCSTHDVWKTPPHAGKAELG